MIEDWCLCFIHMKGPEIFQGPLFSSTRSDQQTLISKCLGQYQLATGFSVLQTAISVVYGQLPTLPMDVIFFLNQVLTQSLSGIQQLVKSSLVFLPLIQTLFDPSLSTHQAEHLSPAHSTKRLLSGTQAPFNPFTKVSERTVNFCYYSTIFTR